MALFCCLVCDPSSAAHHEALEIIGREYSPRVEADDRDAVVFDVSGLDRVLGPPSVIAREIRQRADGLGLVVHLAMACTTTTAWLLAQSRQGTFVVPPGQEPYALSALPLEILLTLPRAATDETGARHSALGTRHSALGARHSALGPGQTAIFPAPNVHRLVPNAQRPGRDLLSILTRWGLRTLGDLARISRAGVRARLGAMGMRWHQAACGEELAPLVPSPEPPRFVERLELEWPVDNLEALSFVLARLCDDLSASLERADRGAVIVATRLGLVTRVVHERVLNLPAPMRDSRVLRTLILLDLESHSPEAAVDRVEVEVDVTPGRILQGSLLARAVPSAETLATLIARLGALMGETRVGAPLAADTHDERTVAMRAFTITDQGKGQRAKGKGKLEGKSSLFLSSSDFLLPSAFCPLPCLPPLPCLRRFRLPIATRVDVDRNIPVRVTPALRGLSGGRVVVCAGPWRTSGRWWVLDRSAWDRDEWDVELTDGGVYRLARHRATGQWELEGILD
jgi:protein ImuB